MDTVREAEICPRDPASESTWRPQAGQIARFYVDWVPAGGYERPPDTPDT